MIADAVAHAVNRAVRDRHGRSASSSTPSPRRRISGSRRGQVRRGRRRVRVRLGPQVDTGARPLGPARGTPRTATARLACDVQLDYHAAVTVDILDGPVFRMTPQANGTLRPVFQPWHRLWSHSLPVALLAGLGLLLAWNPAAALVGALAWTAHVLADQLGFMGSAVAFPFVRRRSRDGS